VGNFRGGCHGEGVVGGREGVWDGVGVGAGV